MNTLLISSCCRRLIAQNNHQLRHPLSRKSQHIIRQYSSVLGRTVAAQRLAATTSYLANNQSKLLWDPLNWQHDPAYSIRYLSISSTRYEQASSKVEEAVKEIQKKEQERTAASQTEQQQHQLDDPLKKEIESPSVAATGAIVTKPVKKSLRTRVWDEIVHYYHGFRLLFMNINVGRRLVIKLLRGKTLTRREYRLLIRTTGDLFRLVPFSVFIIVPFMEFLLPVFIKIFPGMLPSTFETAKDREVKARSQLKVKLEMAKFLQKTLDEMDMQHREHNSEEAKAFVEFFHKCRTSGAHASSEEIMKFSKLFEDEITLDSLTRQQLTAICKVLEVGTIGTNNFLRFQLRMKLRSLAADDRMIQREGVDSLNTTELQAACRARGMRAYGMSEEQLRQQLSEWINLSLNEKVPPSLLLLSRAMMLPENVPTAEKLKASIQSLPDAVAIQTRAAIGEREGKIDNKTQIEIIRDEQRKIEEEAEELKEEQKQTTLKQEEILMDTAKTIADDISNKDIEVVCDALDAVSDSKNMIVEKEEIKELKEEIAEYKEDVEELQAIAKKSNVKLDVRESPAAKRLHKKIDALITKLDKVMANLEKEKKLKSEQQVETKCGEDLVRIDEVMQIVQKMQKDRSKMEHISSFLERIDDDHDGNLKVDDVLKIFETIGNENINLTGKQIDEIVDLISKEEYLENEEKIQKALAKSKEEQEQQKNEELQDSAPNVTDSKMELLTNADDEKHILSDEQPKSSQQSSKPVPSMATPPPPSPLQKNKTNINDSLQKKIIDLEMSEKTKRSASSKTSA